jgi:hypothetical protein
VRANLAFDLRSSKGIAESQTRRAMQTEVQHAVHCPNGCKRSAFVETRARGRHGTFSTVAVAGQKRPRIFSLWEARFIGISQCHLTKGFRAQCHTKTQVTPLAVCCWAPRRARIASFHRDIPRSGVGRSSTSLRGPGRGVRPGCSQAGARTGIALFTAARSLLPSIAMRPRVAPGSQMSGASLRATEAADCTSSHWFQWPPGARNE